MALQIFLIVLFAILSIILLMGKGSFLIAGYNTSSAEKKSKYDEKKLCRVMGSGLLVITIIMAISTFYNHELPAAIAWLQPWGTLITTVVMIILANTICHTKK